MAVVYINLFILLPRFFLKRKFTIYILLMSPLFFGTVFLLMLIERNFFLDGSSLESFFSLESLIGAFISTFIILSMTALLKFLQEWYRQQERNRTLEYNQLQAEHKLLRMQVQPHFLFNVLNNIYSLAVRKSEHTGPAILQLADLMRYLLYESDVKTVSLEKEVKYIEDYIGLQTLKLGANSDKIKLNTLNISPVQVEPMLLIPFVENAFKHSNLGDVGAFLNINISLKDYILDYSVQNTFDPTDAAKDDVGGIGIENVRNRLRAHYPERHELLIERSGNVHTVRLKIYI